MLTSLLFRRLLIVSSLAWIGMISPSFADPVTQPVLSQSFGKIPRGDAVTVYTLTNKNGMSVGIMDYGATIVKIMVPDRNGKLEDVALGFDRVGPYLHATAYFGATVGRYANRIAKGAFTLSNIHYQLPINNGPNSLHGGLRGFDKRMWKVEPVESDVQAIRFSRLSLDGEEGYPGNLFASVTFSLSDDNRLTIAYQATTDKPTIVNLTNHTYFNLAGAGNGTILGHVLTLHARSYTPVDATLIPTGEIKDVAGTPFDFLHPTPIGLHLTETGGTPLGYDHNFVLQKSFFSGLIQSPELAAEVEEPKSGRVMQVYTDQPGIQFYTGNFLDGSLVGKGGKAYAQHSAFCLETQHYPDSPNHDNFPSVVLMPGQTYKTTTIYAFGVR